MTDRFSEEEEAQFQAALAAWSPAGAHSDTEHLEEDQQWIPCMPNEAVEDAEDDD
jgi:hypothetical protein